VVIIHDVVQGPALVAAADLVIGGGGTMNREAAVVGTMAWSTFAGPRPHVDECLAREGRLRWINSAGELEAALGKLGIRPAPRGPYAEGFQMILADIRRYLPMP
jgi:predicted glycosyltransferase